MRIICFGEGDFSFAHALLNNLLAYKMPYSMLYATSIDSNATVLCKYPESRKCLKALSHNPNTRVLYGINAILPLRNQIEDEVSSFDHIIFNFPHLGDENAINHSILLAHFMYAAKDIMHLDSIIYISLTGQQSKRWNLFEMANRNGLRLINSESEKLRLIPEAWPGYELRRQRTGGSFKVRVRNDQCITFSVRLETSLQVQADAETAEPKLLSQNLFEAIYIHHRNKNFMTVQEADALAQDWTGHATSGLVDNDLKDNASERRQLGKTSTEKYSSTTIEIDLMNNSRRRYHQIFAFPTQWESSSRHRQFDNASHSTHDQNSTQGCKTFQCLACYSFFSNQESLNQHTLAKHSHLKIPPPDWAKSVLPTDSAAAQVPFDPAVESSAYYGSSELKEIPPFACIVCGHTFANKQILDTHTDSLSPRTPLTVSCLYCNKLFPEERARVQHMLLKHYERTVSQINSPKDSPVIVYDDEMMSSKWKCAICLEFYSSRAKVFEHLYHKHQSALQICASLPEASSAISDPELLPFWCQICYRNLKSSLGYFNHMLKRHRAYEDFLQPTRFGSSSNVSHLTESSPSSSLDQAQCMISSYGDERLNKESDDKLLRREGDVHIHEETGPGTCPLCSLSKAFNSKLGLCMHIYSKLPCGVRRHVFHSKTDSDNKSRNKTGQALAATGLFEGIKEELLVGVARPVVPIVDVEVNNFDN